MSPRSSAPTCSSAMSGSSTIARMSSSSACRSSPLRARSASASVSLRPRGRLPRRTAPGRTAAAPRPARRPPTARPASAGSGTGGRRRAAPGPAPSAGGPTPARNRRRSAGSTDRSSVCASSPRRNASFSSSAFTAAGRRRVGPGRRATPAGCGPARDRPPAARPARALPLRGQQRRDPLPGLLARPLPRGRDALQDLHHARPDQPRRDRYSHASRNSSFGESCSIARANRNSSRSFHRGPSTCRQPR